MDPELSSSVWPLCLSHWTWVKNNLVLCICQHSYEKKSIYSLLCVDLNSPSETKGIAARKVADLDKSVVAMCTNRDGSVVAIQYESGMVNRLEIGISFLINFLYTTVKTCNKNVYLEIF
nr:uncharacterized protein LOC122268514 [Parasteatoda tepidariorum]